MLDLTARRIRNSPNGYSIAQALGNASSGTRTIRPAVDDAFETAVSTARSRALGRLLHRQAELTDANRLRLDQERQKLERYYEYRVRAADEKLASVRNVFERVSASDAPEIQRIVPVWLKNLENAKGVVDGLAAERERRMNELNGREQVTAQHELLGISFISIVPQTVLPL